MFKELIVLLGNILGVLVSVIQFSLVVLESFIKKKKKEWNGME
jgi:predicted small integral membrane protein